MEWDSMGQRHMEVKLSKRKKYHALIVNDKISFIEPLTLLAKEKENIELYHVTNFEHMKEELPKLVNKISCIILDVLCLITKDQEKVDENFIGIALTYLNQSFPELPRIIFTGEPGLFSDIKRYHSEEILLTKSIDDRSKLFSLIKEFGDKRDKIRLRHLYSDVFSIFEKSYLSAETENDLINILLQQNNKDFAQIKNNLVAIRRIQECIFQEINKKYPQKLPDENFKENKDILFGKIHKHLKGNKSFETDWKPVSTEYYSGVIESFSECIYRVSSDNGAHNPYENPIYKPTVYTVIALTNQLLDFLLWFKAIIIKEQK